ncbi:MAG: N4-gp56 family major capsid protein, partial [Oscillospiraceae bacterium]|nr:N4-gp56 family major capsid protein [Oscillospiraceae bacterium]
LRAQNAPTINGDYVAIIHPYVAYDLMRDPDWRDPHKYVDTDNMYEGEIGKIAGVRFVQTTEAKIYRGADLCSTSRTLTLGADLSSSAVTEITYSASGVTIAANELVGRKIMINGVVATVTANTASSGTHKITVASTTFGAGTSGTTKIYPGEGGANGLSVFASLFFGDGAYGVTEVEGGGLQTIVKQKGSAGTADPLDQRSSVGWKALKTAEILIPSYLIRVESCSARFSANAKSN